MSSCDPQLVKENETENLFLDTWVWSAVPGSRLYRRLAHSATQIGSYLFIMGGHDGNQYTNDLLLFNLGALETCPADVHVLIILQSPFSMSPAQRGESHPPRGVITQQLSQMAGSGYLVDMMVARRTTTCTCST